jgi:homocysteine S-methyltransferase
VIGAGSFVTSVELTPPTGSDATALLEHARRVAAGGARVVNVAHAPGGRPRMGGVAAAHLVQAATGLQAVAHVTGRGRDARAIEADLLGAAALGIRTVLALSGDGEGDGTDSVELVRIAARAVPDLVVGVAFDPGARDLGHERERLRAKVAAGARFAMSQPVLDRDALDAALADADAAGIPLVVGVLARDDADVERARAIVSAARGRAAGAYLTSTGGGLDAIVQVLARP